MDARIVNIIRRRPMFERAAAAFQDTIKKKMDALNKINTLENLNEKDLKKLDLITTRCTEKEKEIKEEILKIFEPFDMGASVDMLFNGYEVAYAKNIFNQFCGEAIDAFWFSLLGTIYLYVLEYEMNIEF